MSSEIPVEAGKVREFARAVQTRDGRYQGPDAVVTPTFLHAEEEFRFHGRVPHAGETLTVTSRLGDEWTKDGKRGGTMRFITTVDEFRDEAGELVAEQITTLVETARTFGPVTRTDIVRDAGASGDFNPIHHDEGFATSAGFPAGLLATYATDWLGADNVRRFTVRFKEQVWPDDVLTCTGVVTAADDVELSCARQTGGVAIAGSATFEV